MDQAKALEQRLRGIYSQAHHEIGVAWTKYMEKVNAELKPLQEAYDLAKRSGDRDEIRRTGMALGRAQREKTIHNKYYRDLTEQLASEISRVNGQAIAYVNSVLPDSYARSYNEMAKGINSATKGYSFALVDSGTVRNLATSDKTLLPYKTVNGQKDVRWNTQKVNAQVMQGILQGESVDKIANRLSDVLEMNEASAMRNARTSVTSAQNKGRFDMLDNAAQNGIIVKKEWVAALDDHTRESHADMDGELQDYDEEFSNGLMFPGDPDGPPEEVYNCRCRMGFHVVGVVDQESGQMLYQNDNVVSDKSRRTPPAPKPSAPAPVSAPVRASSSAVGSSGTIAGVKQGEAMTHAEADTGRVNPNFADGGGYRINCQSCVCTYEARMRGFDVEVVPNDKAHPMCSRLARDSTLMWQNEDGSPATYLFGTGRWESKSNWVGPLPNARRFETKLQETLSEDARYTLGFKWRGFNSGHIVMLEKDGPDLVIYDPQSNRLYRGSYASSYLDRIAYSRSVYGSNYYKWPEVMRVDDKRFVQDVADAVMIPAGGGKK